MKITKCNLPSYYDYGHENGLDDFEISEIEKLGIDEVWYFYSYGSYEGSGEILMRKGDLYDLHDAGHCSCYGPIDRINFIGKPLSELADSLSSEYKSRVRELFEKAGHTWTE